MYVARDKDGDLWLYGKKPYREDSEVPEYWETDTTDEHWIQLDSSLFPELKWEDEPIKVELKETS